MTGDERYSRQKDLVPPDRLAVCKATVVGVGAIGRQVALQLASMGITWLELVDFDLVEPSNLASQGYLEEDLGKLKVEATAQLCRRINGKLVSFPPGRVLALDPGRVWLVEFHRGGEFGAAEYELTEGAHKFVRTHHGWDLIRIDPDAPAYPTTPGLPQNPLN